MIPRFLGCTTAWMEMPFLEIEDTGQGLDLGEGIMNSALHLSVRSL